MIDLFANMKKISKEAEHEICSMLSNIYPKRLLAAFAAQTFLVRGDIDMEAHAERNPPFLIELLAQIILKKKHYGINQIVYPEDTSNLRDLLMKYSLGMRDYDNNIDSLARHIKNQFSVIRGNFFFWQSRNRIENLYANFDKHFESASGISPIKALQFIESIPNNLNAFMENDYRNFCFSEEFAKIVMRVEEINKTLYFTKEDGTKIKFKDTVDSFKYIENYTINNFSSNILVINKDRLTDYGISESEFNALIQLLGISSNTQDRFLLQKNYPLCVFDDGDVIPLAMHTMIDSLINAYEQEAKKDNAFYNRFQKFKSKQTEAHAYQCLKNIFPHECVFKNLSYQDPDKEIESNTELDFAVLYGKFLILCEVKSKQIRSESLAGDTGRLRTDLKANIEDAYTQAHRAVRYINSVNTAVFTEISSNRKLHVTGKDIDKIFIVSATYESLSDIATQIHKTEELALFSDGKFPFSVSTNDLNIISLTSILPETFLHYIERRISILQDNAEWMGDELDLFGAYLDCRLLKSNLLDSSGNKFNMFSFSGYANVFNELEKPDCVPESVLKTKHLRISKSAETIFNKLQATEDDSAKWILFKLHDIPDEKLHSLSEGIIQAHNQQIPHGMCRRFVINHDDIVLIVSATQHESLENLLNFSHTKLFLDKYRSKSNIAILFSVKINSGDLFESVEYLESEWQHDEKMENLLTLEGESPVQISGKRPGRNALCPCGSGKKFKRCCLKRIGASSPFLG